MPHVDTKLLCRMGALILFCVQAFFLTACQEEQLRDIEDGSVWEQAIEPGFGSTSNYSIVAMAEYGGRLYAMTRNETEGAEIWRTDGSTWEQVPYPGGEANGIYGNPWINCLWGEMIVFQDKLYCGFSSGCQGRVRRSSGCEVWRYDGSAWEPVISDRRDAEQSGAITAISGCEDSDAETTAEITDSTKSWEPDQWAGGVLQITSGDGRFRRFDIVGNTSDTLVVQQNEVDSTANEEFTEYTICAGQHFSNPFPPHETDIGAVAAGDSYEIGTGADENGFGDYWNRMITGMTVFEDRLFVSTGLNYERGGQIWFTRDGDTWTVTEPANSFGNFHDDERYADAKRPVSTSITDLCVSAVSGEPVLYAGGTGASGNKGRCSRMARLTASGWELIVDAGVDDNDEGSNENGFGCGMDCSMWNGDFMPWSLADFRDALHVGIQSIAGARVVYTPTGSPEDGSWFHSVGGDAAIPNGFDGVRNAGNPLFYQNTAASLFVFQDSLYAGLMTIYSPTMGATQEFLTGAHLWKTGDGLTWQPVTRNGFGDAHITGFDCFAVFRGALYLGANKASVDGPDGLVPEEGGMIYRQVSRPEVPAPAFDATGVYAVTITQNGDPADIYYPDPDQFDNATGRLPVALLLQGGRVDRQYYSGYARHVASYGFIVVVPNHEISFSFYPGNLTEGYFSQMRQITDTIAFMEQEDLNPDSPVAGHVDTGTLVMLGHSYGAACTIGAIQEQCEYPFCDEGEEFVMPEQLKAAALCGINTKPRGKPFDYTIRETANNGFPLALINGSIDNNATYDISKISYERIHDPPKAMVFIKGANHYAMCDRNNPPGPGEDPNEPEIDAETSIETAARWSALFLRAHALNDRDALAYVHYSGKYLDPNVEVYSDPGE